MTKQVIAKRENALQEYIQYLTTIMDPLQVPAFHRFLGCAGQELQQTSFRPY